MSRSTGCPELAVLRDYAIGRTTDEAAEVLDKHLADCAACRQDLPGAVEEDDFVAAFRHQAREPILRNALINALCEKLNGVIEAAKTALDGTDSGEGKGTVGPCEQPADDPEDWRALLGPAQRLDEIGRLGPYRVLKVIGTGGMGVVFQAEDPQLAASGGAEIACGPPWPPTAGAGSASCARPRPPPR